MAHCQSTTPSAHFRPSSRRMAATAATQGVYSRLKASMEAAVREPRAASPPPKRVSIMETTLSLAMKPLISEVTIRQSPSPTGAMIGARSPATAASMLSWELSTRFSRKSKLDRNQTMMVAIRITEKARCRKSLDFSHSSRATFRGLGNR